jgi:2-keto-4-pentenoate hydratase
MTPESVDRAARLLLHARQNKYQIEGLPAADRPKNLEDGYAIQRRLFDLLGGKQSGWFLGGTNGAPDMPVPYATPILLDKLHESPAVLSRFLTWYVDVEFGFTFGDDIAPRNGPYALDEILGTVKSVHPALDIVNSHFKNLGAVGWQSMLADNGSDGAVVRGTGTAKWHPEDLNRVQVKLLVDGEVVRTGFGERIMGNPVNALIWFVNYMSGEGRTIRAGEFLATGCCTDGYSAHPGQHIKAEFGQFGSVEAILEA